MKRLNYFDAHKNKKPKRKIPIMRIRRLPKIKMSYVTGFNFFKTMYNIE